MTSKASDKTSGHGEKDYMVILRDAIRRYIRKYELNLKFKKMGMHVPNLLDEFVEKKKSILGELATSADAKEKKAEKTSVYNEQLDSASYAALYEECWELLQVLFARRAEEVKRK
jgi:hypothetical protein